MNVFNLIKDILELIYYFVGIFGIIGIFISLQKYKEDQANKLIDKISLSQKEFESLRLFLYKQLGKSENETNIYVDYCFSADIIEYLQGNGDLKNSTNFKNIKETEIPDDLIESINTFFNTFKKSILYIEQKEKEIDKDFFELLKEYLAYTIIPITKHHLNFEYKDEIIQIGEMIGASKVAQKVTRNNRWEEICK